MRCLEPVCPTTWRVLLHALLAAALAFQGVGVAVARSAGPAHVHRASGLVETVSHEVAQVWHAVLDRAHGHPHARADVHVWAHALTHAHTTPQRHAHASHEVHHATVQVVADDDDGHGTARVAIDQPALTLAAGCPVPEGGPGLRAVRELPGAAQCSLSPPDRPPNALHLRA